MLWCIQVAPSNENGLKLRVYGEKGGQVDKNITVDNSVKGVSFFEACVLRLGGMERESR